MKLPHPESTRADLPEKMLRVEAAADFLRIHVWTFYQRLRRDPSFPRPVYPDNARRKWWSRVALARWARRQALFQREDVQKLAAAIHTANFDGVRDPFVEAFLLAGGTLDEMAEVSGIHVESLTLATSAKWTPEALAALHFAAGCRVIQRENELIDEIAMSGIVDHEAIDNLAEAWILVGGPLFWPVEGVR